MECPRFLTPYAYNKASSKEDQGVEDILTLGDWTKGMRVTRIHIHQMLYGRAGSMLVSSLVGQGTVCTGAQREPAMIEPLGTKPFLAASQPRRRPKPICSLPARYIHVKRPTRVQLPVLQHTNARSNPGRGAISLAILGDRYKIHVVRIDTSATSAMTFTLTSSGAGVGVIERLKRPSFLIPMDRPVNPLPNTQPRPQPLQRKTPTNMDSPQTRLLS